MLSMAVIKRVEEVGCVSWKQNQFFVLTATKPQGRRGKIRSKTSRHLLDKNTQRSSVFLFAIILTCQLVMVLMAAETSSVTQLLQNAHKNTLMES